MQTDELLRAAGVPLVGYNLFVTFIGCINKSGSD